MFTPVEDRFASDAGSPAAFYRRLTGVDPAAADITTDAAFDRHVFACTLAAALSEGGSLAARLGLAPAAIEALADAHFPQARALIARGLAAALDEAEDDEAAMVRDLLLAHRARPGRDTIWLAAIVARRAIEPNHLWEDLGLRARTELTRLLERHFTQLAAKNTRNMRWKRFFYRSLCETDGFVMCTTPVCSACGDFDSCFGEESGESRLARIRRAGEPGLAAAPASLG
jgi:nitrogen fixation protein NifQ